jgi:hypothetical protein
MTSISISLVDTLYYEKDSIPVKTTINTLKTCQAGELKCFYWFSDQDFPVKINIPVKWIKIPKIVNYPWDYNRVMLELLPWVVQEDFTLVLNNDGYATNPGSWDGGFLNYDYIGASIPWYPEDRKVGNGGFSLRSKKLLNAITKFNLPLDQPEDYVISFLFKDQMESLGVKFAPTAYADKFSLEFVENSPWEGRSFGFHGRRRLSLIPVNKTLVFCTSYSDSLDNWEKRYRPWVDYITVSGLIYDQILLVDDCSPVLPEWSDTKIVDIENQETCSSNVQILRFSQRKGTHLHGGWYRSFGAALKYAVDNGYTRVIHIESDAYLVSAKAIHHVNNILQGWYSPYCPVYQFPESAIQVINQDQFENALEFFSQPLEDVQGEKVNNVVIEKLMPFTEVDTSCLKGDRYNERWGQTPQDADFSTQVELEKYQPWWFQGLDIYNNK